MSRSWKWIVPAIAVALSFGIAHASGPIGIYALITRVVLEPNAQNPERIQIWGVFSLVPANGQKDAYQAPKSGYLYYKVNYDPQRTLAEWNDLKSVAGKRRVVGFEDASTMPMVRKADQRPENPEPYNFGRDLATGTGGVVMLRSGTDFPPVKALLEFREPGGR